MKTIEEDLGKFEERMVKSFEENLVLLRDAAKAVEAIRANGFPREHQAVYDILTRLNIARKDALEDTATLAKAAREVLQGFDEGLFVGHITARDKGYLDRVERLRLLASTR